MLKRLSLFTLVFALTCLAAWAQQGPFVGTWKQNLAKSKYSPGPPPAQGNVTKIEAVPNGLKVTTTNNPPNAQGVSNSTEWTAYYDGKDYPMKDTSNAFDSNSLKKTGPRTLEAVSKKDGKVMRTSVW